jgi:hypothetical protein
VELAAKHAVYEGSAMIEPFVFDKGMNLRKSPLYLKDGEVVTASGFSFESEGVLEARPAKTQSIAINISSSSAINGIHRYIDSVLAVSKAYCPGDQVFFNYVYQRDKDASAYTEVGRSVGNTRPRFGDYEKFIFMVDGQSKRAYIDDDEYEWGVENPVKAPGVADSGVAGNPDGTYYCYVTYYIIFPNDKVYETAASAAGTVTVVTNKITWSSIPICPYEGEGLVIHRYLYRTVSGTAYLLKIIDDNTTQTYTDDVTDAALQAASAYATANYSTPPDNAVDIDVYLQRVFLIKESSLYWSEPYIPFGFKTTSDVVVTKEDEELIGIIDWGDQVYIASKEQWYRLQGSDPTTWSIKRTFTDNGIINRHTLKKSKFGLIGLDYDGIYIFDGATSQSLTEKILGKSFFTDLDDLSVCYAEFDGEIYYFYYASSGSTLDSCLRLDFTNGRSDIQLYTGGFLDAHELYREATVRYQAYNGYEYTEGGTETIVTSLLTGDQAFKNIGQLKNLEYLYYDIDTNSIDVTVIIYVDGTAGFTITLNTSSRKRARSEKLPQLEGYRFSIGIDCADSQSLKIYGPWLLEATAVGK